MEESSQRKVLPSRAGRPPWQRVHPHYLVLTLSLFGSVIFFLFLVVAMVFSRGMLPEGMADFTMPVSFYFSLALALINSALWVPVLRYYREDKLQGLFRHLSLILVCSVAFMLMQALGWSELYWQGVLFDGQQGESYLWLISILHGLHLLALFGVCLGFYVSHLPSLFDPVKGLVFLTTPYRKISLQLLSIAYHFIDVLWIVLFLAFLWVY